MTGCQQGLNRFMIFKKIPLKHQLRECSNKKYFEKDIFSFCVLELFIVFICLLRVVHFYYFSGQMRLSVAGIDFRYSCLMYAKHVFIV